MISSRFRIAIFLILLGMVAFTGYYFKVGLDAPDKIEEKKVVGYYTHSGKLDYHAKLKPNLIYEKQNVSNVDIYTSLLENMSLKYTYSFTGGNAEGSYSINLFLTPSRSPTWEKKIFTASNTFNGGFTRDVAINWSKMLELWNKIERETNYNFGSPTLRMEVFVNTNGNVEGNNIAEKFNQTFLITYGKLIKFSETEKSQSGKVFGTVEKPMYVSVFGMLIKPSNAKILFGVLFALSITSTPALVYFWRGEFLEYVKSREKKSFEKKYGRYIVKANGRLSVDKTVDVVGLDSIGKLSNELDKPILKYDDKYVIIDGDYAYVSKFD